MRSALNAWLILVACAAAATTTPARAADIFYFTSTPGSWIGQGQTLTLTPVTATRTFNLGAYTNTVKFSAGGYELDLVGPNNTLVGPGFYNNAYRWPFNDSRPGMWMTAPGRGDNDISGWFNILQADYNTDGTVQAFAVDFKEYDETSTTNWTTGSVRYHSSIPTPEPGAGFAMLLCAVALLPKRRARQAASRR
jgi:hypothetical protein